MADYGEPIVVRGRMKDRIYPNKPANGKPNTKVYFGVPDSENNWTDYSVTIWEDSVEDYEGTIAYLEAIKDSHPWYIISGKKKSFTKQNGDTAYEIVYPKFIPESAEDPKLKFKDRKKGDTTSKMEEAAPRHQAEPGNLNDLVIKQMTFVNEQIVPGILAVWRKVKYPEFKGEVNKFTPEMAQEFLQEYMELAFDEGQIDEYLYTRYTDDRATMDALIEEAKREKKAVVITTKLNEMEPVFAGKYPFSERVHLLTVQQLHQLREYAEAQLHPEKVAAEVL